tara:strand:+ start:299 stop:1108 length:810 start_codon:yes stop_codon:yes gene_type:complete
MKLINDNCIDAIPKIKDCSIDLTVTSPPYDNLRTYNNKNALFGEPVWQTTLQQLYRVTKQGGVVVWVVGDATIKGSETGTSFKQALYAKACGFNLHDTMIYQKNSLTFPDTNRYYQCFEYMFVFSKGKPNTCNQIKDKKNKQANKTITGNYRNIDGSLKEMSGSKNKRQIKDYGVRWNIWQYNTGWQHSYTEDYLRGHPAIFPLQLAHDHIISWSKKGDTVLDPFMGSGTTGVACLRNNRNFIGIEIDTEYYNLAKKRIKTTTTQGKLL